MSDLAVARHIWVSGRVQGVWFRARTQEQALSLELRGWVRNLSDGRVEVWAQGPEARLEQLLAWLAEGPPLARVDWLEVEDAAAKTGIEGFEIV